MNDVVVVRPVGLLGLPSGDSVIYAHAGSVDPLPGQWVLMDRDGAELTGLVMAAPGQVLESLPIVTAWRIRRVVPTPAGRATVAAARLFESLGLGIPRK